MNVRALSIFLVEDDPGMRDMLTSYLQGKGLHVTPIASAEDMLLRLDRLRPDLIVLDIGLPGITGLQACQRLRMEGDRVPIVMLTARSEEVDRVMGLELGADDYVGKPFSARELLARIQAVMRRATVTPGSVVDRQQSVMVGEHEFIVSARCLRRNGESRPLNTVEYALLAELCLNPGVPISRERLLAVSHQRHHLVSLRSVDAAIVRLRKLVEPDPAQPVLIQTVRNHGYLFVPLPSVPLSATASTGIPGTAAA